MAVKDALWTRWRRCQHRQHEQSRAAGVSDAMSYTFRRHEQIAGAHVQLAIGQQEQTFAFEHVVDLVLPGVRVQRMLLAGLAGIEPDQQPRRLKNSGLAHLLW